MFFFSIGLLQLNRMWTASLDGIFLGISSREGGERIYLFLFCSVYLIRQSGTMVSYVDSMMPWYFTKAV
jgi:hypothetical protein